MKQFVLLGLAVFLLSSPAYADHALPNGNNTFYLNVSGIEHDPELLSCHAALAAWRDQGYLAEEQVNSFVYIGGYNEFGCPYTVNYFASDLAYHQGGRIVLLETYQHANPLAIDVELYAHTPWGLNTRNQSWDYLRQNYTPGSDIWLGEHLGPAEHPEWSYYSIQVGPSFFARVFRDASVVPPDLYFLIGSDTADTNWESLLNTGVRCLILLHGSVHYVVEDRIPWWRMNGRGWWGLNTSPVRLRTAPLAFIEPFRQGSQTYMVLPGGGPLWDVNLSTIDSLALTPRMVSTTVYPGKVYGDSPELEQAVFSCRMNPDGIGAGVSGLGGAWVKDEQAIDNTVYFNIESVRYDPFSFVRFNGVIDDTVRLRSLEGNHPVCYTGHGPVGADSLIVVSCTYYDDDYAAAYESCIGWHENGQLKVWLMGVEQGTTMHRILGGPSAEGLRELASIPGSGFRGFVVDELLTLPDLDVQFVSVIEEPDGSTSRVSRVLDAEPAEHVNHVHHSGVPEFIPTFETSEPVLLRDGCPDWVLYGPPELLYAPSVAIIISILQDLGYSSVERLESVDHSGWQLRTYLQQCKEVFGAVPKGATILGSGNDDPGHPDNIVSPYKWDGCVDCYWTSWQSGDAHYGMLDDNWQVNGWHPDLGITRIAVRNVDELNDWCQNAIDYHVMAHSHELPRRALALLGDEEDSGILPDTCNAVWQRDLLPFLQGHDWSVQAMRDSDYPNNVEGYLQSHQDFAAIRNSSQWCSYMVQLGPTASWNRTAGYLVHKGSGSNPWDGSLFDPALTRPFGMFAPLCGTAGVFQNTIYWPPLPMVFKDAVFWIGCSKGGLESFHMEWLSLWDYYMPISYNSFDCYKRCLLAFTERYPEHFEYAMGMVYLGIPMEWQDLAVSIDYEEGDSRVNLLRCSSPFRERASVAFNVPGKAGVRLALYDVTGRKVCDVHESASSFGEFTWDARSLDSGVYFLRLEAGGRTLASARVVHVK